MSEPAARTTNASGHSILTHDDAQAAMPFRSFIARWFVRNGLGSVPELDRKRGVVKARIRQGRWVVLCENPGCSSAVIADEKERCFICAECGSPENDRHWYTVQWPAPEVRHQIEELLLARPAISVSRAWSRNWEPGESLADLQAQNALYGVGGET